MKTAIVSVTKHGAYLGQKVAELIRRSGTVEFVQCYEKEGKEFHSLEFETENRPAIIFKTLSNIMGELFNGYDRLLCIMATGIVVRLIAPYVVHKSSDPAVLVMDEQATFVISLLSGHLGGANEWTKEIAGIFDAIPVITTATDVNNLPAPDNLARKYQLNLTDFDVLKLVNAAVVAKEEVPYYIDKTLFTGAELFEAVKAHGAKPVFFTPLEKKVALPPEAKNPERYSYSYALTQTDEVMMAATTHKVVITDKIIDVPGTSLFLRPRTITVGVGCRRDTEESLIYEAITDSLAKVGRSKDSVLTATSVDLKADEVGLLQAIKSLKWSIHFYKPEDMSAFLDNTDSKIHESNFVKQTIGVGNVCETTALLMAQSQTLIQMKTIYPRTTVAIAQVQLKLSELALVMQNL